MTLGVCELLWVKNVLSDLGFKPNETMSLYCDNTQAITIAHNPIQHDRTKHVEIDRHFIKEKLEVGIIFFPCVRSELQLAGVLTKGMFLMSPYSSWECVISMHQLEWGC